MHTRSGIEKVLLGRLKISREKISPMASEILADIHQLTSVSGAVHQAFRKFDIPTTTEEKQLVIDLIRSEVYESA